MSIALSNAGNISVVIFVSASTFAPKSSIEKVLSIAVWILDFLAISALLDGFPHHAATMVALTLLPGLVLSVRQRSW